jgi:hypothetical protein
VRRPSRMVAPSEGCFSLTQSTIGEILALNGGESRVVLSEHATAEVTQSGNG